MKETREAHTRTQRDRDGEREIADNSLKDSV